MATKGSLGKTAWFEEAGLLRLQPIRESHTIGVIGALIGTIRGIDAPPSIGVVLAVDAMR